MIGRCIVFWVSLLLFSLLMHYKEKINKLFLFVKDFIILVIMEFYCIIIIIGCKFGWKWCERDLQEMIDL